MSLAPLPFEICFSIAGMPARLSVLGLSSEKQALLQSWYAAFLIDPGSDDLGDDLWQIQVQVEAGDLFIPFQTGLWQVHTYPSDERIEFISHQEKGWFSLPEKRGELTMRPEGNPENFLRVIYSWRCLERDAVLLHASGVIHDGGGYVFFGPSGSGKTTIARLSSQATVLSDDLVILQRRPAEGADFVQVHGVPFRGEMIEAARANASAPLRGLYMLVKDSRHYLADLPRVEAAARLSACIPFVMSAPERAQRALSLCDQITRLASVKALHFARDPGFWKVIDG